MDALPEISLGSAALIIFAVCAAYMFLRGILRTIVNAICLMLSAWVGLRVWQQAPALSTEWLGTSSEYITTGLPVVAGFVTFLVLRKLIRFIRTPAQALDEDGEPKQSRGLLGSLLLTLIPTALLWFTGATLLRHASSVAEMHESVEQGEVAEEANGFAARLKKSVTAALPEKLMDWIDPVTSEPRLKLAKMIIAGATEKDPDPVIDPETGEPYPRAIIVDDPELTSLAKEGRFSTLLRHPLLTEALKDPAIREKLGLD